MEHSKRRLEEILQAAVRCFAYPFGAHDPATVVAARAAGYTSAVTTVAAHAMPYQDLLTLPRHEVKENVRIDFAGQLSAMMSGLAP
jgi:hypothetical protein